MIKLVTPIYDNEDTNTLLLYIDKRDVAWFEYPVMKDII
jgi:hypothetical protein